MSAIKLQSWTYVCTLIWILIPATQAQQQTQICDQLKSGSKKVLATGLLSNGKHLIAFTDKTALMVVNAININISSSAPYMNLFDGKSVDISALKSPTGSTEALILHGTTGLTNFNGTVDHLAVVAADHTIIHGITLDGSSKTVSTGTSTAFKTLEKQTVVFFSKTNNTELAEFFVLREDKLLRGKWTKMGDRGADIEVLGFQKRWTKLVNGGWVEPNPGNASADLFFFGYHNANRTMYYSMIETDHLHSVSYERFFVCTKPEEPSTASEDDDSSWFSSLSFKLLITGIILILLIAVIVAIYCRLIAKSTKFAKNLSGRGTLKGEGSSSGKGGKSKVKSKSKTGTTDTKTSPSDTSKVTTPTDASSSFAAKADMSSMAGGGSSAASNISKVSTLSAVSTTSKLTSKAMGSSAAAGGGGSSAAYSKASTSMASSAWSKAGGGSSTLSKASAVSAASKLNKASVVSGAGASKMSKVASSSTSQAGSKASKA